MLNPVLDFTPDGVFHLQPFKVDSGTSAPVVTASLASVGGDSVAKSNGSVHEIVVQVFEVNAAY